MLPKSGHLRCDFFTDSKITLEMVRKAVHSEWTALFVVSQLFLLHLRVKGTVPIAADEGMVHGGVIVKGTEIDKL